MENVCRMPKKYQPKKNEWETSKAEKKFQAAREQMQKNVAKYTNYESSSEEEELETSGIIDKIVTNYSGVGGDLKDLERTQGFLEESLLSGAATCLICIGSIKRVDPIWSCIKCFSFFHLECIKRWAKDSIVHQKRIQEDQNPNAVKEYYNWCCPKCREEYSPEKIPTQYLCFCLKTVDPKYDLYLPPHSCGETCGKNLIPECGHKCVIPCHPGPCPPCPKTINSNCFCGKQKRLQRCSNKFWGCGGKCNKLLTCGKHPCNKKCHSEACLPCPKQSLQKCDCKSETELRECASPNWKCNKVCGKKLSCKNHLCETICHSGDCIPCPLTDLRFCPCGKQDYVLPCTKETPTCGDTCGKILECGFHECLQRCHREKCGNCLEVVTRRCRCGLHMKELPCQKEFLCETKCKQIKDCGKHPCNRKCCDGNCSSCEKPCGRNLRCGIHKCASACHRGPCYPCRITVSIKCKCGGTSITVPCGRQKKTKPPKCSKLCKIPPDCHHKSRISHACHFGDCPPCIQICDKKHLECGHLCPWKCHSNVLIKIEENGKASMPWEQKGPQLERRCLPCPDCTVSVPVQCLGLHEISDLPCHRAKSSSCQRLCGRELICGNHTCALVCHQIIGNVDGNKAAEGCENCESGCTKPRPEGCSHECPKPCHPGICPPCKQMLRLKCHCGLNQIYMRCSDWIEPEKRISLLTCNNRCPKNYECGHRCRANCHPGDCPDAETCHKKVKISCDCKRLKREFHCEVVRNNEAKVDCNEECLKKIEEAKKVKLLEENLRKEQEKLKNAKELEEFQKKFQTKKKYKEKKRYIEEEEQSLLRKYWYFVAIFGILLAISFIFMIN